MSLQIDFSKFNNQILQAIEETGKVCRDMGNNEIDSAYLVAGLCQVDNSVVKSVLENNGFDFQASMQRLAEVFNMKMGNTVSSRVDFSPEVTQTFAYCDERYDNVDLIHLMDALVKNSPTELACYLVRRNNIGNQQVSQPSPHQDHQTESETHEQSQSVPPSIPQQSHRNLQEEERYTGNTVKQFGKNMLKDAAEGKIHNAIGREEEVDRVLLILARSTKNNPVLVGEPGTGKTAIAEELAIRLYYGNVPDALKPLKLYSIDFSAVKSSQDPISVMQSLIEEGANDKDLVFFIDEIHMLISNNSGSDNDIANLLKPAMARGEIKILGATTLDEYRRIESDPAFERRFQKVNVDEPDLESAFKIVSGAKKKYEEAHEVVIPDSVCKVAVDFSATYITNRKLPDKAFDLLDEASANLKLKERHRNTLEKNDVLKVITNWTGIPVDDLDASDARKLQNIEEELHSSVVGQDKAVKAVADAIKRNRMGFGNPSKPIGTFLFLGTSGTGKTELSKALAKFLFKDPAKMVRIDMSEYQQEFSVQRLFGAPPGYVGYEEGGQLTEAVYRKPFSVVLFDEIEKAHPKILETLLQVLDDGRMTDGKGKVVNFKNTIIIMTSNMGQQAILQQLCRPQPSEADVEDCTNKVLHLLKQRMAPEFLNRIDNIVMFLPLQKDEVLKIAELNLKKEEAKFKEMGLDVSISQEVAGFITDSDFDPQNGGRPVKRAIVSKIINPLTTKMVNGEIAKTDPIYITVEDNHINISNGISRRI
ncbi:MAG: ATP-dependent Clp protease ATP-binding subunit [Muribaculaceae bacterium]|nr:ATP-dependent Clp protease ATP-binding subunit [Muribaculaceae bacterium]